jgi:hypothetical protein
MLFSPPLALLASVIAVRGQPSRSVPRVALVISGMELILLAGLFLLSLLVTLAT